MPMGLWMIGIVAAVAVLLAVALMRRSRDPAPITADPTAPVPAPEPAQPVPPDAEEPALTPSIDVRAETLRALRELAFATALPPVASAPSLSDELCAEVAKTLRAIVEKPNYAPRRPMQLPRLMQAINDETASRGTLSQIIAGDPALAGNLLRLANSPFYRHTPEPIESLDRAVAMLGTEGLRSMVAAALLQPVFRVRGGSFARFGEITWEHSLYAAGAAENFAAIAGNADPFAAQLLALIFGLATIVVFSVAQDAFLARNRKPEAATIAALIDAHAIDVGRQIASSWELSERIDAALAEQSATLATPLGRALQFGEFVGAVAVLQTRSVINEQTAAGILRSVPAPPSIAERVWVRLGFKPE